MGASASPYSVKHDAHMMERIFSFKHSPLDYVMYSFPWGQKGTPLEHQAGPRKWQKQVLLELAEHIQANRHRMAQGQNPLVFHMAVCSGRGIGKSALVAWLILWFMSCVLGGSNVTTANTEEQLKSKTWAELGKWHTMAINSHWFERTALSLRPEPWFAKLLADQMKLDIGLYYGLAQLWSEDNPDAFAGLHNTNGTLLVFDEASGIPSPIWKVSEGFFTESVLHRYWFVFSNGRRNTGSFFECFHKLRAWWKRHQIDSRTVEGTDQNVFQKIIDQNGEDSDEARVEVKGEFPRQGDKQFISRAIVEQAVSRELVADPWAPLIMGVDPARYGDDSTVIAWRQGRNGRVRPMIEMKGADNMAVANRCAELIEEMQPDAVNIDAGNGTGIIDRLREMGYKVNEVWFGSASSEEQWGNFRTYIWAQMRDWLGGGCIDNHEDLSTDLTSPDYKFLGSSDRMVLESKDSMKSRGFASPDRGDALACTFAFKVARRDNKLSRHQRRSGQVARDTEYSIFGD